MDTRKNKLYEHSVKFSDFSNGNEVKFLVLVLVMILIF